MEESPYEILVAGITSALETALEKCGYRSESLNGTIDAARGFGDIACSASFRIAKERGESPDSVAKAISAKLEAPEGIREVSVEKGYLNFHMERGWFGKRTVDYALGLSDSTVISTLGAEKKTVLEYPSVNPNKPWHIGQLRNALLGDSASKIHRACGYAVEREDYIDDLGLQIAESLWGYINMRDKVNKKFDYWLGELYVKVNKRIEDGDKGAEAEVTRLVGLMEQDGTYEGNLRRELSEQCVRAQYETAFSYGIYHDVLIWESDIVHEELLKRALIELEKSNFIKKMPDGKYANCMVIDLEGIKELPPEFRGVQEKIKVLVRADGTPTYVAKDIAFHMWKFGMLGGNFKYSPFIEKQPNGETLYTTSRVGKSMDFGKVAKAINIIGNEQAYPQSLVRLAFASIGREDIANSIHHLSYGRVNLEEGKLAGRKGTWLEYTADRLLEETTAKAKTLVGDRFKLASGEQDAIATKVAVSAIKFEFLKVAPETEIIFSWKRALDFEGNSGPYCQYMFARGLRMIIDSAFVASKDGFDADQLASDPEFRLLKRISLLKRAVEKACNECRPSVIAEYAGDLALEFSRFYENTPVLRADTAEQKTARLALTMAFANTMRYALLLLGIETVNRM